MGATVKGLDELIQQKASKQAYEEWGELESSILEWSKKYKTDRVSVLRGNGRGRHISLHIPLQGGHLTEDQFDDFIKHFSYDWVKQRTSELVSTMTEDLLKKADLLGTIGDDE